MEAQLLITSNRTSFTLTQKLADVGCFGVRVGVQLLLLTQIMAEASDLNTEDVFPIDIQFRLILFQRFCKLSSTWLESLQNLWNRKINIISANANYIYFVTSCRISPYRNRKQGVSPPLAASGFRPSLWAVCPQKFCCNREEMLDLRLNTFSLSVHFLWCSFYTFFGLCCSLPMNMSIYIPVTEEKYLFFVYFWTSVFGLWTVDVNATRWVPPGKMKMNKHLWYRLSHYRQDSRW